MKQKPVQYQQGDVLLSLVSALPEHTKPIKDRRGIVLAEGEITGHYHAIEDTEGAQLLEAADRPEVLKVDEHNQPHCDSGPFCRWRDGAELYSLHGVRLPAHYVLRPATDISTEEIMRETNVDIRRELIRKVGIERVVQSVPHKVLDKQGNYELLKIDFPGLVQDTRFLKMLNPSIDVFHLEGVERACNTVQEAINWRAGDTAKDADWLPAQLT